jgi:hypothetical protein
MFLMNNLRPIGTEFDVIEDMNPENSNYRSDMQRCFTYKIIAHEYVTDYIGAPERLAEAIKMIDHKLIKKIK